MRYIILDTETTGLDPRQGHRIIEIAAVEVVDRHLTGKSLHFYVNPEREIDVGATDVHGLTWDTLREKPRFGDIAREFMDFTAGARWIIHNAPFDLAFLDEELKRLELPSWAGVCAEVIDTLELAREQFPGKKNSLDALCERFRIANAQRTLHGALLDARLLAEVYLAMTRGQESLTIDIAVPAPSATARAGSAAPPPIHVLE
ncbi:MAG: DNA polymerase III subunit epsilon, partial [Betaproteobacteria bacterium]